MVGVSQVGPAMPSPLYDADLALLQGPLNGNFIRGAHYPQVWPLKDVAICCLFRAAYKTYS